MTSISTTTRPVTNRRRRSAAAGGDSWWRFLARRVVRFVVSVWVLFTASFLMIHLVPGDPVRGALGTTAPAELVAARRASLGLDDPMLQQYWDHLRGVLTGDLGSSIMTGQPVGQTIAERLPASMTLALLAFVVVAFVAVPLGVAMAGLTRGGQRRRTELGFTTASTLFASLPEFLLAVGLVYVFAVNLAWFPVAARTDASSYVLPVMALAVGPAATMTRIIRVEILTVLDRDFVRTARAKRLTPRLIYVRHALPNALTATLTIAGMLLTSMVVGTVLVENVFAWPGLGTTIVNSILQKDYPLVQGIVLVYGIGVLLVNLAVDVALSRLDPRSTLRSA
jgi:peptide/nickel transport system permease protein